VINEIASAHTILDRTPAHAHNALPPMTVAGAEQSPRYMATREVATAMMRMQP
jgi:hypothetical protein